MKAWGWISMRRSFEDAVKNAFEETTMKNVPIDQFQHFKWRNEVWNWNLREKLSKIGHFGNFDFWSKVNAKSQSQLILGQSQQSMLTGQIRVVRVELVRVNGQLGDVVLTRRHCWHGKLTCLMTWTGADVDVLAWLLTWSNDVTIWRQMTSAAVFQRVAGACDVHRRVEEKPETREAHVRSNGCQNLGFCKSVDEEAVMAARVPRRRSESHESEAARGNFPELVSAHRGTWQFRWRLASWVWIARGRGSRICSWFR